MLILINAEPNRAGCRLRWWNLKKAAENHHQTVKQISLPSEKIFRRKELPKACLILPHRLQRVIRKILLKTNQLWFLINLAAADSIVTGKPNDPRLLRALRFARCFRTKIIVDACDIKPSYTNINEAFEIATHITLPTQRLIAKIPPKERHKVRIIPDSLDRESLPGERQAELITFKESTSSDIVWFGVIEASGPSDRPSFSLFCDQIKASIQNLEKHKSSITLVCSRSNEALQHLKQNLAPSSLTCISKEWSLQTMREELGRPGIVVIPYPEPIENCPKSANRIELSLYAGKKVIVNGLLPSLDLELQRHVIIRKRLINPEEIAKHLINITAIRHYLDEKQNRIDQLWYQLLH